MLESFKNEMLVTNSRAQELLPSITPQPVEKFSKQTKMLNPRAKLGDLWVDSLATDSQTLPVLSVLWTVLTALVLDSFWVSRLNNQ